jgi:anti-sigma-K factor RskA
MGRHIERCGNTELLIEYSAGKLHGEQRAAVERHIAVCEGCRKFLGAQRALFDALDAWDAPAVSADFDRRLRERMREVSWRDRLLAALHPALTWKTLPIVAAAGLALVAGLVLQQRPAAVPPPQTAVQQVEPLLPDQMESVSQDIEMLREWNGLMSPDAGDSEL